MKTENNAFGEMKRRWKKIGDRSLNMVFGLCVVVVLWLVVQVFAITSFRIPSDSMEPTLLAGDNIWVEKWSYGARLFNVWKQVAGESVEIHRLPGIGKVKRNDVVVFHNPCPRKRERMEMDMMKYYVKRCTALPGEVFFIRNGRYGVEGVDDCIGDTLEQDDFREWIERNGLKDDEPGVRAYPSGTGIGWTVKEFGPFLIPKRGSVIVMNHCNAILYGSAIERETGGILVRNENGTVSLNDSVIREYRFCNNYYFMTGDKVENSRDSRYWGLVPEDFIVGKVWRIWKSVDKFTDEIRWERFGKSVE